MPTHPARPLSIAVLLTLVLSTSALHAQSAGALGNGLSAAAVARGGTMVTEHGSPLDAVEGNPAGLAGINHRVLDLSGLALVAHGTFTNSVDNHGTLRAFSGALPYAAFAMPLGHRFTAAAAVTPEFLMRAAWQYTDPAGTAGVTYGEQKQESQFIAVRGSASIAYSASPKWSFGSSLGLVYNQNLLHAPYIFQQQPALAGLKVLLDLHTKGFGWNGSAGAQYQPNDRLRFGISYKSPTFIPSHGYAQGSAYALFNALGVTADPTFQYQAEVDNHLPQAVSAGARWQINPRVRLSVEGGFANWATAFHTLPVKLKEGTNPVINSVAGSSAIQDEIALHWRNQAMFRTGVEIPVKHQWTARAGYSFLSNPVPSSTITPLTAAILSNGLSTGLGYQPESSIPHNFLSKLQWDAAYQLQLPANQSVGTSSLEAGEYSNSHIHVLTQSVTISTRLNF
ncbi:long-subunit fatty acid transport protein [Granulicella aggregans]|uniref:Long-subunit fatty acid transport protein n=1 Tax=Granulicella aggregans TaxID=474949 RepID=A0A7W8E2L9_9BACT|nr:outer membrane protein transport protein [Granulicella aggregans]MBB5056657.1 long-subunit fatty acid transport protein [Granulicella aggregans]